MNDEMFMELAIAEAEKAAAENEIPVGAIAVLNGEVIASEHNRMEQLHDATAHAEILLIRKVSSIIGDWRLSDITIYVTKEPCAMCAGALVNARVKRLVYGLPDPRSGCCGSALDITGFPGMLWQIPVTGGVLADEAGTLIKEFFKAARRREK
jgi:tRNA(adenine34) deaminase